MTTLADPNIPLIDDSQLTPIVGEDLTEAAPLLLELLDLYTEENEVKIEEIKQSCLTEDREQLAKQIHFVAGSSGNMGLQRLCSLCRALERLCLDASKPLDFKHLEVQVSETYQASITEFKERFGV